jgi:maltose O-acetyltransferase
MAFLKELLAFLQYGDLPTSYFVKRGMKIGKNFNRQSGTRMDPSHCWLISIGDDVTLANKVQILAHDDTTRIYTGYGRIGRVSIGNRVFIGANSTILMNTKIGNDVIVGAGSVVTRDIPDNCIAAGVPAVVIGSTSDYISREKDRMLSGICFDKTYSYYHKVGMAKKEELQQVFENNPCVGYLELGYYKD